MLSFFDTRTIGNTLCGETFICRDRVQVTCGTSTAVGQLIQATALNAIKPHLQLVMSAAPGQSAVAYWTAESKYQRP
jgi:hypothetical protein